MKRFLQLLSYILVAAVASCVTLIWFQPQEDPRFTKLEELDSVVQKYFIEDSDAAAMMDGAAAGMVDALGDRWSYYMTAAEYQSYLEQMKNAYVGIGITISQRDDGYLSVEKVDEGGPAQEAGMQVGDVLTHVEDQSIAELGLDSAKNMIRGKEGTQVKITVLRQGEKITMTVTRRQIQTVVAAGEMVTEAVGLVTVTNFDERCYQETRGAIEALLAQGAKALIFDVRFNPGGYKSELVDILNYLLPEGPLFRSEDYNGKQEVDMSDADHLDIPMAVLVNDSSYSAAEFFAAALSEYEAAVVVGQNTTGKGYFQNSFKLSDGSAVVISTGKYCTPNGVSLAGVGITPDVVVEVDDETYAQIYYKTLEPEDDPQIQAAIKALEME